MFAVTEVVYKSRNEACTDRMLHQSVKIDLW